MELELGDLHALVSTPSDQPGAKIFSFFKKNFFSILVDLTLFWGQRSKSYWTF